MPVEQLKKIADEADMIVAGYAFTKKCRGADTGIKFK